MFKIVVYKCIHKNLCAYISAIVERNDAENEKKVTPVTHEDTDFLVILYIHTNSFLNKFTIQLML